MSYKEVPSEMYRSLQGIISLNAFADQTSASRLQMFSAHLGQKLVTNGMTERYCQTGMEQEFGKYTFAVEVPVDCLIIAIIPKYKQSMAMDAIGYNPSTIIVYEDEQSKEVGFIELPLYKSYHSHFGFAYKEQKAMSQIRIGNYLKKGTKLLDSPGITEDGNYMYGVELNMAFMSHPAVSEDGIMISRDALDKFKFKTYETKVVEWGKRRFPLNLYGDDENYKPFPDIGEFVRDDCILMALRNIDPTLAVVRQGMYDCQRVNQIFDKRVYADGVGGRIIDIRINTNDDHKMGLSPTDVQLEKYITETKRFYSDIIKVYRDIEKDRGASTQITPQFHRLMIEALAVIEEDKGKISKLYRKNPLDEFRVEFTIEYETTPRNGYKFTDTSGG